jgi:hypothetical protein
LESNRLESIAWNHPNPNLDDTNPNEFVLSAGWQSDFALFTNHPNSDNKGHNVVLHPNFDNKAHNVVLHPRDLAEKSESEADAIVEQMAAYSISLPPHLPPGLTNMTNTEHTRVPFQLIGIIKPMLPNQVWPWLRNDVGRGKRGVS